jgi:outer membrane protein insertion porin family
MRRWGLDKGLITVAGATLVILVVTNSGLGQTDPTSHPNPCADQQTSGKPTLRRWVITGDNATLPATEMSPIAKEDPCTSDTEVGSPQPGSKLTIRFEGLVDVSESDLFKEFRERGVQLSRDPTLEPDLVEKLRQSIKECLVARGYRHPSVNTRIDQRKEDSQALVFVINQGPRPGISEFRFQGNRIFSSDELAEQARHCMKRYERDFYDAEVFEYCLYRMNNLARSRGYLQARLHDPKVEENEVGVIVTTQVDEGVLYRLGEIKIEGASLVSREKIRAMLSIQKGEVIDGERVSKSLYEDLKEFYGENGYIQYTAEVTPEFRLTADGSEGIADFEITIDEGQRFKVFHISLIGTDVPENQLRELLLIHDGDIYNQTLFEKSIDGLNNTGLFEPIDKDKDVDYRANAEEGFVDVVITLKKRS